MNLISIKVEEFKESMETSLKGSVDEFRLFNEEQVLADTTLVGIMKSANVRIDEKFRIQLQFR